MLGHQYLTDVAMNWMRGCRFLELRRGFQGQTSFELKEDKMRKNMKISVWKWKTCFLLPCEVSFCLLYVDRDDIYNEA